MKILFLVILSAVNFTIYAQNTIIRKINTKEKVGYIQFDPKSDNPDFELCDENNIMEYYQVNPIFTDGNIQGYFEKVLTPFPFNKGLDGYITIRFVINCNGKTDRFRLSSINKEYSPGEFPEKIKNTLLNAVKNMEDWIVNPNEGEKFDCYKHLSFKIKNGQLIEVVP